MALNARDITGTGLEHSGGGMLAPDDPFYFEKLYANPAKAAMGSASKGRRQAGDSFFNPRRGLLLTAEQLAGPAVPEYVLRRPYVYARQNLL